MEDDIIKKIEEEEPEELKPETLPDPNAELEDVPIDASGAPVVAYLRFLGAYEGDVQVKDGKYVHAFLFHCQTIEGKRMICPMYCLPNHYESVKKAVGRLIPLLFSQFDETQGVKKDIKSDTVTPVVEHLFHDEGGKTH